MAKKTIKENEIKVTERGRKKTKIDNDKQVELLNVEEPIISDNPIETEQSNIINEDVDQEVIMNPICGYNEEPIVSKEHVVLDRNIDEIIEPQKSNNKYSFGYMWNGQIIYP